ncbi:MAG TPA: MASE1 domain-containing protein, partial [Burkholderiaceae bacterium]|nr:MASE1 domain-containing protein [Burkholderiaceae bacterium]
MAATAFVCCVLARWLAFKDPTGLILWPGAAVALAFGWRNGVRWVVPAALGSAAWALVSIGRLEVALTAAAVTVAGPALSVVLLHRLNAWKPADYRLEAVIRFILVVTLLAAPFDALLAAAGLHLSSALPPTTHFAQTFGVWWMLDVLGMLLVTPALLAWINDGLAEPEPGLGGDVLIDAPALLLTGAVIAGSLTLSAIGQRAWGHPLLYFYFPIVAWTAVRLSERATALSLLATAVPLLAVRAFTLPQGSYEAFRAIEAGVIVLCALLLALIIQAVAADRRFALARVALQARQDMSTGLLNDRGLLAELNDRLMSPTRTPYGLVGVHLSNFDALNDLCGPMRALQLEQNVAELLQRQGGV